MANKKLKSKPATSVNQKASAELRSSDWLGIFSKRVQSRLTGEYAAKYHPGWYPESNKPITSLAELCAQSEQALLKRMGFGSRALKEVRSKLVERGMSLATDHWGIAANLRATKASAKLKRRKPVQCSAMVSQHHVEMLARLLNKAHCQGQSSYRWGSRELKEMAGNNTSGWKAISAHFLRQVLANGPDQGRRAA